MLWLIFFLMILIAGAFIVFPGIKSKSKISPHIFLSLALIFIVSSLTYYYIGNPSDNNEQSSSPSIEIIIESLEDRLIENPQDLEGWKILANTYSLQKQFLNAFDAYERAIAIEEGSDADTFANFGESLIQSGNLGFTEKANEVFEKALQLDKYNTKSLFYGGIAADSIGRPLLAAERWERLLALSPPNDIRETLEEKIKDWRSDSTQVSRELSDEAFFVEVNVSDEIILKLINYPNKILYVIARNPSKPSPPIAVIRKEVSSGMTTIDDSAIMIPGIKLSSFDRLEFIARISLSGGPLDRSGNYSDAKIISTIENKNIILNIK